jgi:hypothetical protein
VKTILPHGQPILKCKLDSPDPRSLRKADVSGLVEQVTSLSALERSRLCEVLIKYLSHVTTKPGKCSLLQYKFQVQTERPIIVYFRPIPFAVRQVVRLQINQMLEDDILEISTSPILNPLTVVSKGRRQNSDLRGCP